MKFGLGAWSKIIRANCLPGKNPAQLNLQTQRMMGQQSLGGTIKFYTNILFPIRIHEYPFGS